MRRIVMFNLVTADGRFAGTDGNLDWFVPDTEFDRTAAEMIQVFDTVVLGRITYQLFERFWPGAATDPATSPDDRVIAHKLNDMTKLVFSRTLETVTWKNSRLLRDLVPGEIEARKQQLGGDMVVYGSGSIVQQLTEHDLIDEYQFVVNPVLLGKGRSLLDNARKTVKLELIDTRTFASGNVLLRYARSSRPARRL